MLHGIRKVNAIRKLMGLGLMSINEARSLLGLEPVEVGISAFKVSIVDHESNLYQAGENDKSLRKNAILNTTNMWYFGLLIIIIASSQIDLLSS